MTTFVAKCDDENSGCVRHIVFSLVDGETVDQVSRQISSILDLTVIQVEPIEQFVTDQFYEICTI